MANSIELSLWEMQCKLSAIAEIPKILASTLATVSQSYENVQRKCSYDEDALDYELIKEEDEEDEEDDEKHDLVDDESESDTDTDIENKMNEVEQSKLLVKDVTPESDYASEANYATNEPSDESNDDEDNVEDEDEDEDEDDGKAVYFLKLPAASSQADEENETDTDTDNSSTDSDFLSTTYTWNLRNAPKLRINDDNNDDDSDNDDDEAKEVEHNELKRQEQYQHQELYEKPAIRPATPTPTPTPQANPMAELQTQKLLFKLDKLERSWPWADREKIIYKQSTCHLVPRKPLGLVGQRMQLLLKDKTQQ
ncbi:uncharacterized protein Dwil_GK17981 [Drosophila willistoni]|uniref:Uncharacterized protein n=2 Tax=Drosophila willistoni TaxID=7260 RepID=B4N611_DROWI|nr:uncharacterized protein Dwil_GK17981 [Drosophila willistoni]